MGTLGVILAFGTATSQSVAYVLTRQFVVSKHGSVMKLMVMAHLIMGVFAAVGLSLMWDDHLRDVASYAVPLAGSAGWYLVGQGAFFVALRKADASRVSPLLGLKIGAVAILAMLVLGIEINAWQWLAVGVSVAAAFVLNASGGWLPWPAVVGSLTACVAYALADIDIIRLVGAMGGGADVAAETKMHASVIAALATYVLCGLVAAAALPWFGSRRRGDWYAAAPFAGAWLVGMFCFFGALAMIGPVLGNIILATRGVFSIILGACLARLGMVHLEQKVSTPILVRRAAAAVMMIIAIGVYMYTK
ncbi:MAG: EamA family transporter [Phycisphaera sp.]|nr:EamA family transporter [Phycisphaera sp.]